MRIWHRLLETAVHAPSPHNVQPWRVKIINDREADLFIDRDRTLPKEDVTGSFIILTMGLFVESLKILAAKHSLGLDFELRQTPDRFTPQELVLYPSSFIPFARLRLYEADLSPDDFDEDLFY